MAYIVYMHLISEYIFTTMIYCDIIINSLYTASGYNASQKEEKYIEKHCSYY